MGSFGNAAIAWGIDSDSGILNSGDPLVTFGGASALKVPEASGGADTKGALVNRGDGNVNKPHNLDRLVVAPLSVIA